MPADGTIDSIKVGLGIDTNNLSSQLATARRQFDQQIPDKRTVHVNIRTHVDQASIASAYKSVQASFNNISKQGANTPQALKIAPRMVVDPRVMRDFRRDIERNMMQAGRSGQSLRVPIKFNGDTRGFIASVETSLAGKHITVGVHGRWEGWGPGGGPPGGGGPAGGSPRGGGAPGGWTRGPAGGRPTAGPSAGPSGPRRRGPDFTPAGVGAFWADQNARQDATDKRNQERYDRDAKRAANRDAHAREQARREYERRHPGTTTPPPAASPPTGPAGTGPASQRPARGRASTTATPDTTVPVTPATPAAPSQTRAEQRAANQATWAAHRAARSGTPATPPPVSGAPAGAPPPQGAPAGAPQPTPRQQRRDERRDRMSGATPPPPSGPRQPTNTYGPGNMNTVGATVNPDYVEPSGGRVTVGNVRSGSAPTELQGTERAVFISQQRARPTRGTGLFRQPGEPVGTMSRTQRASKIQTLLERRAKQVREEQAEARSADPRDRETAALFKSGFHFGGSPQLAAAFDLMGDPSYGGSFEEILKAKPELRSALASEFPGLSPKQVRRQLAIAGGRKKGDVSDPNVVHPKLLAHVAGYEAIREFRRAQVDPLHVVKKGDPSSARGGKVGPMHGRSAGILTSSSQEPIVTEEKAAKARRAAEKRATPIAPIVEGQAYGGFMEDAPTIQGGQGMSRKSNATIAVETSAARRRESERRQALGGRVDIDEPPAHGRVPSLHERINERARAKSAIPKEPPRSEFGAAGRPRTVKPPTPESRAYQRAPTPGDAPKARFRSMGAKGEWEDWNEADFEAAFKHFESQGYDFKRWGQGPAGPRGQKAGPIGDSDAEWQERLKGTHGARGFSGWRRPSAPHEEHSPDSIIGKLIRMAGTASYNPEEASNAVRMLRKRGIPGFAEGGLVEGGRRPQYGKYLDLDLSSSIHGRYLRGMLGFAGPVPRPGTQARVELEDRARAGIRNRRKYEKKPLHHRGGSSDPEYKRNRATYLDQQRRLGPLVCAVDGKPVIEGDKGPDGLTVDHTEDVASGGTHSIGNFKIMCNRHNGYKGGGQSARDPYLVGQRTDQDDTNDPWGHDRNEFEEDLGAFRRSQGFAEGGKTKLRTLGSMSAVRALHKEGLRDNQALYLRWTDNLARDRKPGAISATLFDRSQLEVGVSASRLSPNDPWLGIDSAYDFSGQPMPKIGKDGKAIPPSPLDMMGFGSKIKRYPKRSPYLLRGKPVGVGYDGEDVLDPESIVPVGRLSRNLIEQIEDERVAASRGRAPTRAEPERSMGLERRAEGGLADKFYRGRSSHVDPMRESHHGEFGPGLYLTPYKTMARTFGGMSQAHQAMRLGGYDRKAMGRLEIDEYDLQHRDEVLNLGLSNRIPPRLLSKYQKYLAGRRTSLGVPDVTASMALARIEEGAMSRGWASRQGYPRSVIEPFGAAFQKLVKQAGYGAIAGHGLDMQDEAPLHRKGPNNLLLFPGTAGHFLRGKGYAEGGKTGPISKARSMHQQYLRGYRVPDIEGVPGEDLYSSAGPGRPGLHLQRLGANAKLVVARNPAGQVLGELGLQFNDKGELIDQMPYVQRSARRHGIGSALYAKAAALGIDVDSVSQANLEEHMLTEEGRALYKSRLRHKGQIPTKYAKWAAMRESSFAEGGEWIPGPRGFGGKNWRHWGQGFSAQTGHHIMDPDFEAEEGYFASLVRKGQQISGPNEMVDPETLRQHTVGVHEGDWLRSTTSLRSNKRQLHRYGFNRNAEGGYVKHGGLLQRMAQAGHQPSITMVGERGPELIVTDKNGESEVVPTHKVPMWLQRARSGQGIAKDMTHHAEGGITHAAEGLRMRGPAGIRATTLARASTGILGGGDITRVFVVNWPPFLSSAAGFGQAQGAAAQQGPAQGRAQAPPQAGPQAAQGPPPPNVPGGASGGGPPPGAGAAARARRGVVDPYDRVRAREIALAGERREGSLESRMVEVGAGISEAYQNVPVRAFSVSGGQIAQTRFGGRADILRRGTRARVAKARADRALKQLQGLRQTGAEMRYQLDDIRSGTTTFDSDEQKQASVDDLRARYGQNIQARQQARRVADERAEQAEKAQGSILGRGAQLRSQGVGLAGIVVAGAGFTAAVGIFQAATTAAGAALDPFIQAMLGFPAAIERSTTAVRDAITSARGFTEAGAARAVAPSGVSARFLDQQGGAFVQTGINRAAELAASQALDITRANAGLGGRSRGLYEGVGGLFGTQALTEVFGGQPGFLQDIEKRLAVNAPKDMSPGGVVGQLPAALGALVGSINPLGGNFLQPQNLMPPGADPAKQKEVVDDLNRSLVNAATYAGDVTDAFKLVTDAAPALTDAMIDSAKATGDQGAITRAEGLKAKGITVTGPGGRALQGQEFEQYAEQQARGQLIQDPTLLLRATAPQRQAQAWQMRQTAEFGRTEDIPGAFALQRLAAPPAAYGATFAARADALRKTEAVAPTEAGQKTLASLERYAKLAGSSDKSLLESQRKGTQKLEDIVSRIDYPTLAGGIPSTMDGSKGQETLVPGRPGPALTRFREITGQIREKAQGVQTAVDTLSIRSANLEARSYAEQIRLGEQSLGDANDLWDAINGNVRKTLGGMQGQNMVLDRQNQLLGRRSQQLSFKSEDLGFRQAEIGFRSQERGFNQTQRQINFSVATAGFQAPGGSSEERSARIAEAKIEAQFAQDNLNDQRAIAELAKQQLAIAREQQGISRAQFANTSQQQDNSWAIQQEEAERAVRAIAESLAILKEGVAINVDSAALEDTIARVRGEIGLLNQEAQSFVEQGNSVRGGLVSDTAGLMAETNASISTLITGVQTAWTTAFAGIRSGNEDIATWLGTAPGASGGKTPDSSGKSPNRGQTNGAWDYDKIDRRGASGLVGTVSGPTRFMAGEAGSEHVIVLRNPTSGMTLPSGMGGGGGMTFAPVVNINGATVRNDNDLATIKAIVEDTMNRAASQFLRVG